MDKVYIAPNATLVGETSLAPGVNIWYGAVLRGDSGCISLGEGTNVQDNCVIHEKTTVGAWCTVGHGAILHGCTLKDGCLVGMGAILLDGAVLEEGCMVGAGALVTGKIHAEPGSLLLGNPAKVVKQLTPQQIAANRQNAQHYVELAKKAFGE